MRLPRGRLLSAPLALALSLAFIGSSSVLAQLAATPAERPLIERIQGRTFPSVFQAWSPAQNIEDDSPLHTVARHDLVFNGPEFFGLRWNRRPTGLADGFTAESMGRAKSFRQKLLTLNPNLVLIVEIRYRDAHKSYLPEGHKWWLRNEEGQVVPGWDEGGYFCLDFHNPEFRSQVARQAKAAVDSGAVDGVMLDWWSDDASRLALIQEVRQAIGEKALILANANDRQTPQTAPYINGYFMECTESKTAQDWKRIADTLAWAEVNLREPRINCLETWYPQVEGRPESDAGHDDPRPDTFRWLLPVLRSQSAVHTGSPPQLVLILEQEPGQTGCQGNGELGWNGASGIRERHGGLQSDGEQGRIGDISRGSPKCCLRQDCSISSPGKS